MFEYPTALYGFIPYDTFARFKIFYKQLIWQSNCNFVEIFDDCIFTSIKDVR